MSLETDIQQKSFANEYQKGLVNIVYTSNWLSERTKKIFDRYDITSQQFNILRILRGAARPMSTLQIRQRMLDKMSDTSRIVDRLIKKEFVAKKVCEKDKRLVDVVITKKGQALLVKMDECNAEIQAHLHTLSPTELQQLNALLDKLRG